MEQSEKKPQGGPHALALRALAFLQEQGLAEVPRHFALAYMYFEGIHPGVRAEVDRALAHGALTADVAGSIHDRLFGLDRETSAVRRASETIERTLARVLAGLGSANREVASYGKALADFSGQVQAGQAEVAQIQAAGIERAGIERAGFEGIEIEGTEIERRRAETGRVALARSNPLDAGGEEKPETPLDLRTALEIIRDQTRMMQARTEDLEQRFTAASEEVTELRRDLDEMRIAASTDALTGVANRKIFDLRLGELVEEADREEMPLTLILADIDHFKAFNDTWGHQTGDLVLRLVARTMADCVRGRDIVARYGGEEFSIILPQTDLAGAFAVAENIRKTISSKRLSRKATGENLGMVTLSFGIARLHDGEKPSALVERADGGLYAAKRHGRNRIESLEACAGELSGPARA